MPTAATRRPRRSAFQRLVLVGNVGAMVVFLVAAAGLGYGYSKFGRIPRVEIAEFLSDSTELAA